MQPQPEGRQRDREPQETIPLAEIQMAIRAIQYGTVNIVIQDGKVVQIERTEKLRLDRVRARQR